MNTRWVFLGLVWLLGPVQVMATVIEYEIVGSVTSVNEYGSYLYGLEVGDSITGHFSYDDDEVVPIENGSTLLDVRYGPPHYTSPKLELHIGDSITLNMWDFEDFGGFSVVYSDGVLSHFTGQGDEKVDTFIPIDVIPEEYHTEARVEAGGELYYGNYTIDDGLIREAVSIAWQGPFYDANPTWEGTYSISPPRLNWRKLFGRLAWAFVIIVGGIMITPVGINPIVINPTIRTVTGALLVALGVIGLI